ncbi:MAG: TerB family tellurite resistance protein [Actinomycetota bacterium]
MLERLTSLFSAGRHTAVADDDRVRVACAALLAEAALLDGRFDPAEATRIEALLAGRFGLGADEAATLAAVGRRQAEDATQLLGFTRVLKDALAPDERVRVIEMLWEVAYADGVLHDYEANLVRRVSGLLFVPDHDAGEARKRAMARLGMTQGLD